MLQIKEEEVINLKLENNNLVIAMDMLRKEKTQIANIKKANSELKNQVIHYKALVRRLAANQSAVGAISLIGIDEP